MDVSFPDSIADYMIQQQPADMILICKVSK